MRTPVLLLSLAAITACASSSRSVSGSAPQPTSQSVRIDGVGTLNMAAPEASAHVQTLPFAIAEVWRVLPAVYDSLGIPVTKADASGHVIGNEGLKVRSRLGKVSLSRYLDCGNTQMGPSADNYEVFLTVATQLRATGPTTTVMETALEANARPIQFAQAPSRCATKGELEPRVSTVATVLLGGKAAR